MLAIVVAPYLNTNFPPDSLIEKLVVANDPELKLAAVPDMFVPTNVDGVPRLGVTNVGLVDRTLLPVPVEVPTPVPPLVTLRYGPASNNASIESKSVFILVPHESVDAPTSGLVRLKFVVVVSAIFTS